MSVTMRTTKGCHIDFCACNIAINSLSAAELSTASRGPSGLFIDLPDRDYRSRFGGFHQISGPRPFCPLHLGPFTLTWVLQPPFDQGCVKQAATRSTASSCACSRTITGECSSLSVICPPTACRFFLHMRPDIMTVCDSQIAHTISVFQTCKTH